MNNADKKETIVFGGGCFWCSEAVFQRLRGVLAVIPGYAGGSMENPGYYDVVRGKSGHAEVIQVDYTSEEITLEDLLNVFFGSHDPTTANRQGNDVGPQYRSLILTTTDDQQDAVKSYIERLTKEQVFDAPVTTEVKSLVKFYPAEEEQVDFYAKNPASPYCQVVISPKLAKLRTKFAHLLKEVY